MSDPLSRATDALKELHAEAPAPPPGTRELVLERATLGRRERRVSRAILMPIAAAFILLATWAGASGALSRAFSSRPSELDVVPQEPAASTASSARAVSPAPPSTAEAPASTAEAPSSTAEAPASTAERLHVAAPQSTMVRAVPPTASPPANATTLPPSTTVAPVLREPGDALYAAAHRAHFEERDPARALAAWDAYLADAPQGHFAPEATYNRALCLIRLGRTSEATKALQPFADGAYGAYRSAEAKKLLDALVDGATR